jgi:hypothetical protein
MEIHDKACPSVLKILLEEIFQVDPRKRPPFSEIVQMLERSYPHSPIFSCIYFHNYFKS